MPSSLLDTIAENSELSSSKVPKSIFSATLPSIFGTEKNEEDLITTRSRGRKGKKSVDTTNKSKSSSANKDKDTSNDNMTHSGSEDNSNNDEESSTVTFLKKSSKKAKRGAKSLQNTVATKASKLKQSVFDKAAQAKELAEEEIEAVENTVVENLKKIQQAVPEKVQTTLQSALHKGKQLEEKLVENAHYLVEQVEHARSDINDNISKITEGIENAQNTVSELEEQEEQKGAEKSSVARHNLENYPRYTHSILSSAQGTSSVFISKTVTKRIDVFPKYKTSASTSSSSSSASSSASSSSTSLSSSLLSRFPLSYLRSSKLLALSSWPKVLSPKKISKKITKTRKSAGVFLKNSSMKLKELSTTIRNSVNAARNLSANEALEKVKELAQVPVNYASTTYESFSPDTQVPPIAITDGMVSQLAKDQAFEEARTDTPSDFLHSLPWQSIGKELVVPAISSSLAFLAVYGGGEVFDAGLNTTLDLTQYFI